MRRGGAREGAISTVENVNERTMLLPRREVSKRELKEDDFAAEVSSLRPSTESREVESRAERLHVLTIANLKGESEGGVTSDRGDGLTILGTRTGRISTAGEPSARVPRSTTRGSHERSSGTVIGQRDNHTVASALRLVGIMGIDFGNELGHRPRPRGSRIHLDKGTAIIGACSPSRATVLATHTRRLPR